MAKCLASVLASALGCLFALLVVPSLVEAQSVHRPLRIGLGVGPSIPFQSSGGLQVQLEESLTYAVLPVDAHPGLFVGVALGESFADRLIILQGQARAGFEAQLFSNGDIELLANAYVGVGGGILMVDLGAFGGNSTLGAFNLGVGAEAVLAFGDGLGAIWVRPLGLDFLIRDGDYNRYQILAGGRLAF